MKNYIQSTFIKEMKHFKFGALLRIGQFICASYKKKIHVRFLLSCPMQQMGRAGRLCVNSMKQECGGC